VGWLNSYRVRLLSFGGPRQTGQQPEGQEQRAEKSHYALALEGASSVGLFRAKLAHWVVHRWLALAQKLDHRKHETDGNFESLSPYSVYSVFSVEIGPQKTQNRRKL